MLQTRQKKGVFLKIKRKLDSEAYDQVMLMGDFNAVTNPQIDKAPCNKGEKLPGIFLYG